MTFALRETAPALAERYRSEGFWTDDTFASFIDREIASAPDLAFRVWSTERAYSGTLGGLYADSLRLASSLEGLGIGVGDVVAYQVPNWQEAVVTIFAGFRLGAALVPIVHFYGAREVEFILRQCEARVLVTVERFAHVDHIENLAGFRDRLDALEHVIVIDAKRSGARPTLRGRLEFDALFEAKAHAGIGEIDPDRPAMIGYTSGTTADPKGVIHSHRSLLAEVVQLATLAPDARPLLNASPLAHMTGMLGSLLVPLYKHREIHLTDRWDPDEALRIMLEADVSAGSGATIFLTSLLDAKGFSAEHARKIGSVGLGGSPVPAAVGLRAEEAGIAIQRSYGSTEHPSITGSEAHESREKRIYTDGRPMRGVEIRLLENESGLEVRPGEAGQIHSRGPDLCVGYTDPAQTARSFDREGWYSTGDVGVLDEEGFLTITDRVSDVIIRGGTNLSAAEIEEIIMMSPLVAECAVVATPDDRLGERALAVLRLRAGAPEPDLGAIQAHLEQAGLPRQKWVEDVRIVDDFPRTPSGKIRKFVLRDQLRQS